MYQTTLVMTLLLFSVLSVAADYTRQTWEDLINKKLVSDNKTAEIIYLDTNADQFLGLYAAASGDTEQSAVIIAHQMGAHADWPQIISPIRKMLPQYGWSTLSIQLPILPPDNSFQNYGKTLPQAAKRLKTAIEWFRERQFTTIIIIGHSFGAASALTYLEQQQTDDIQGLVAIGLQDYAFIRPRINIFKLIQKANLPILDIYGERDFKRVIQQAVDRRLAVKKDHLHYKQVQINDAVHNFKGMETILIEHIVDWLKQFKQAAVSK